MSRINFLHNKLPVFLTVSKKCPHCNALNFENREYCISCHGKTYINNKKIINNITIPRLNSWHTKNKAILIFLLLTITFIVFTLARLYKIKLF